MFFVLLTLAVTSCAQPVKELWRAKPPFQSVTREAYVIEVQPLKVNEAYYGVFLLRIHNRSPQRLELDWNVTRYLHNGKDEGPLVFQGVDPEKLQGAMAPTPIAAGTTFTREIFPLRTIAFLPRNEVAEPGRRGFTPGVLPAGENTIQVALRQGDRLWQERLTVQLQVRKAQQ